MTRGFILTFILPDVLECSRYFFLKGKARCPSSGITGCIKFKIGELTSSRGFSGSTVLSHSQPWVVLQRHCDVVCFLEQNSTVSFQPRWAPWEVAGPRLHPLGLHGALVSGSLGLLSLVIWVSGTSCRSPEIQALSHGLEAPWAGCEPSG